MKPLFSLLILTIFFSCSQTNQIFSKKGKKPSRLPASENSSFSFSYIGSDLGKVVYSILDRETFRKINGPGWELMDGRCKGIKESDLYSLLKNKKNNVISTKKDPCLPDARGRFI